MRTLIVVPTYNERENILQLLPLLLHSPIRPDVLVVDDGSPDGTAAAVRRFIDAGDAAGPASPARPDHPPAEGRVALIEREGKLGLGSAYIRGFRHALQQGYDCVFEMDADLSHPPEALPRFMEAIAGAHCVVGSRYVRGGRIVGWSLLRWAISFGGNLLSRLVLRCGVRDMTSGYRCYRAEALRAVDLDGIISEGYFFQVEMLYTLHLAGFTITEIPITFTDRRAGESKMSGVIFREALGNLLRMRREKEKRRPARTL
ncbi:MAG: polyprenol monophosphomannose synthase [Spirochaetota bacterium]